MGLDVEVREEGKRQEGERREGEKGEGKKVGLPQNWLVHITLKSGHGLAIRDRTGIYMYM